MAIAYHWAERDMLSMPLQRRLSYLMLLEEDSDAALFQGLTMGDL